MIGLLPVCGYSQVVLPSVFAMENSAFQNPAMRVADTLNEVGLFQRYVWFGNQNSPVSNVVYGSSHIKSAQFSGKLENFSFGFYRYQDARLCYNYEFRILQELYLSFGLDFGYQQVVPKRGKLRVWDQGDYLFQSANFDKSVAAVYSGAGASLRYKNVRIGWSQPMANFFPINTNGDAVYSSLLFAMDPRQYIDFSYSWKLSHTIGMQADFYRGTLIDEYTGKVYEWQGGVKMQYDVFESGLGYRSNGEVFMTLQALVKGKAQFRYAANLLALKNPEIIGLGNHEIGVSFVF